MHSVSIWNRFMAMVYESILLVGPVFFSILVVSILSTFFSQNDTQGALHPAVVQFLVILIIGGYFTWGWSHNRVTLPMKTLNLKIVSESGGSISKKSAIIRFAIAIPSVLSGTWSLVALIRKDRLCPQDIFSKTRLVQLPNESTS